MTVYMFPGQGSQKVGMGEDLFDQFAEIVKQADEILGYSIKTLCLTDPEQKLNTTQYTQPALYVVNALTYFKRLQDTTQKPQYVLGHSLGEYNALLAAEVFDFATGLTIVQQRGQLMAKATGGAMAAVVGLTEMQVKEILAQQELTEVEIANYNTPTQFVISGLEDQVARAAIIFSQQNGCIYVPLKVSGAFHSKQMKPSQEAFAIFLKQKKFNSPTISVIANVNARPYTATNVEENLIQQIASPVRWTDSIKYLLSLGEENFEEIGPGKVLSGLVRKIR